MVQLCKKAFPDLSDWDRDSQTQRAHRLLFNHNASGTKVTQPRPILIYIRNFLLRQAVSLTAHPTSPVLVDNLSIVARSDLCRSTMDRRWKLRQFIDPLKAVAAQAFLQEPALLKIMKYGRSQMCFSEEDAAQALARLRGTNNHT